VRRWAHEASSLAFSPDGKLLASGNCSARVILWDPATGKAVRPCKGNLSSIHDLTFSPDGRTLFAGSAGGEVYFWDTATGNQLAVLPGHEEHAYAVAVSPDGRTLASVGGDKTVRLWDIGARKEIRTLFEGNVKILSIAFSPDGKTLAWGDDAGTVRLWDLRAGQESTRLAIPARPVDRVAFRPDGKSLAAAARGGICLWDLATGKETRRLPLLREGLAACIAFSPDGRAMAAADGGHTVRVWDLATGAALFRGGHEGAVTAVAFTENGKHIWSGSEDWSALGIRQGDSTLREWTVPAGRQEHWLRADAEGEVWCAFSPGARVLAAGGSVSPHGAGVVQLWDGLTRKELRRFKEVMFTRGGAVSRDGGVAAYWVFRWSEEGGGLVRLQDLRKGSVRAIRKEGQTSGKPLLSLSPDGRELAEVAGDPPEIRVWDVATARQVRRFQVPEAEDVCSLAFSPDGRELMIGARRGERGMVGIWEISTGRWRCQVRRSLVDMDVTAFVAWSADGRTIACGSGEAGVSVWEAATGGLRCSCRGHAGKVLCAAFSAGGEFLATGGTDCTVLLWDLTGHAKGTDVRGPKHSLPDVRTLWRQLASADAGEAYRALQDLVAAPRQAVSWLREHLQRVSPVTEKDLARLIAQLGDDEFAVREKATTQIEALGELATPTLRRALAVTISKEARRRIEQLLDRQQAGGLTREQLRSLRALEVLEHIGSREARLALEGIAEGAPEARLTQEARASVQRLAARLAQTP
jgi:WD40 repeat protein